MIRLAGRTQNPVIQALFRPGLWLQYPDDAGTHADQIEVAIEASTPPSRLMKKMNRTN